MLRPLRLGAAGAGLALLGLWVASPAAAVAPPPPPQVAAVGPACSVDLTSGRQVDTVLLVIAFPDEPITFCVDAGGNGIELLEQAGLEPQVQRFGANGGAVCAVTHPFSGEQVGCAVGPSCLTCRAPDYWGYFPGYSYSQVGAGGRTPGHGSVEGWQWGRSTSWQNAAPQFADTCQSYFPTPPPPGTDPPRQDPPGAPPPGTDPPATDPPGADPPATDPPGPGATDPPGSVPPDDVSTSTTRPPGGPSAGSSGSGGAPGSPEGPVDGPAAADDEQGHLTGGTEAVDGDRDERSVGVPPAGTVSISDADGAGGRGALVPMAGTSAVVAAFVMLALRARRRREAATSDLL